MRASIEQMIQDHFNSERGKRQLKRGPSRDKWANAAMSIALLKAVQ